MNKKLPTIDVSDINKVRRQALKWAKRTLDCKWASLPFYCMRIGRCMRKLGFQYTVFELTDCNGREVVYLSLDYTEEELPFKSVVYDSQSLYRDETDTRVKTITLSFMITEACQQLADYIYEASPDPSERRGATHPAQSASSRRGRLPCLPEQ